MDDIELEEGELSDESMDNNYTPLERPSNYSQVQPYVQFPVNIKYESDEEEAQDPQDSSDSDSDAETKKRTKKLPKVKPQPAGKPAKKKYDIWCTRGRDTDLSAPLNNMLMDQHSVRHETGLVNPETAPRSIMDLTKTVNDTDEELSRDIANKLLEERDDLILKVVTTLGKEKAIEFFKETQKVEAEGGLLICNLSRRRTPGGVYLFIVRKHPLLTNQDKKDIFGDDKVLYNQKQKEKRKTKSNKIKLDVATLREQVLPELMTKKELEICKLKQ